MTLGDRIKAIEESQQSLAYALTKIREQQLEIADKIDRLLTLRGKGQLTNKHYDVWFYEDDVVIIKNKKTKYWQKVDLIV